MSASGDWGGETIGDLLQRVLDDSIHKWPVTVVPDVEEGKSQSLDVGRSWEAPTVRL